MQAKIWQLSGKSEVFPKSRRKSDRVTEIVVILEKSPDFTKTARSWRKLAIPVRRVTFRLRGSGTTSEGENHLWERWGVLHWLSVCEVQISQLDDL